MNLGFGAPPLRSFARALAGIVLTVASTLPVANAAEFTPAQKSEIEGLIKSYLVQNPEVLQEAMAELERRQKTQEEARREQVVDSRSSDLFNGPNSVVVGNPQGKVTLVEFFDYNCGYCKRALDDISKLLKTEPELRLVLKDFPVLGPGSVEAAQIAGAARNQLKGDRFWQFHFKLLSTHGPVGKTQALAAARDAGADMDLLTKDFGGREVKSEIEQTMALADALSLTGTPSFVVGKEVVVGAVGYDELKGRIDNVLKCGRAVCS